MRPRILLVEDESAIADTVLYALRTDGFDSEWCTSGEAALASIERAAPALVVLDVGLPDIQGFELFHRLRARSDVPVVFLTARSAEIDRVVGLELGADDYLTKPFSPRELVARIRSVLRRSGRSVAGSAPVPRPTEGGATRSVASCFEVDDSRRVIRCQGQALLLSRYEYGLLCTLLRRPGHVYTREALLDAVWGDDSASLDRTVDAHVKTLRAKLKAVAPGLDPIRTHRGIGYALSDDPC
jgi:two-component system catabolic regulation response regulator CreB